MEYIIRQVMENDLEEWLKLGLKLWTEETENEMRQIFLDILLSEKENTFICENVNKYIGFVNVSIRSDYVEGSNSTPVGYIEGIYVEENYRKKGIANHLIKAAEKWAKEKGCKQMGSDIEYDNTVSYDFHKKVGFNEAGRIICFIKDIEE
ncbi:MAG: GNAT family N-acetyltransferase [Maledivibacter sp.]|jgi:aminoglycoside 6'-N-acetyltransferase I|nr:GNAT family N-acetyltransferase [Maledivibacter sp.]